VLWDGAEEDTEVWFLNADGSVAEVCGNGLRAVAAAGRDLGFFSPGRVEFRSGPSRFSVIVGADDSPVAASLGIPRYHTNPGVDDVVKVWRGAGSLVFVPNPHVVVFDGPTTREDREKMAGQLVNQVTGGANIGFCSREGDALSLHVWERGVGWTIACGSGAAAAAAAACRLGLLPEGGVSVRQPGGELRVWFGDDGCAWIEGTACLVFVGYIGGATRLDISGFGAALACRRFEERRAELHGDIQRVHG